MERILSYPLSGVGEGFCDVRARRVLLPQHLDIKRMLTSSSSAIGSNISVTSSSKNLANAYSPVMSETLVTPIALALGSTIFNVSSGLRGFVNP
jgi:hypothetical protein